jgi:hypothetical protein
MPFPALLLALQLADTVTARLAFRLAEKSPRTPAFLGEVSGFTFDRADRLFISDIAEAKVLMFGTDGKALGTIGRRGKGPNELEAPTGPVIGPDGSLFVRDMSEVERFAVDPKTGLPTQRGSSFAGPMYAPWRSFQPSVIDAERRFHFPQEIGRSDGKTHVAYRRYTLTGKALDSLPVPLFPTSRSSFASVEISPGTGRMVPGIATVPFHPHPAWAVTPRGTIVAGAATSDSLQETDAAGRVVRRFASGLVPPRIVARERAESARAFARRLDTLPVPAERIYGLSEESKARRLPERVPAFVNVVIADDGTPWLQRWPGAKGATLFSAVRADGRPGRTLRVPATCATSPAPVLRGRRIACLERDPETGSEAVAVSVW